MWRRQAPALPRRDVNSRRQGFYHPDDGVGAGGGAHNGINFKAVPTIEGDVFRKTEASAQSELRPIQQAGEILHVVEDGRGDSAPSTARKNRKPTDVKMIGTHTKLGGGDRLLLDATENRPSFLNRFLDILQGGESGAGGGIELADVFCECNAHDVVNDGNLFWGGDGHAELGVGLANWVGDWFSFFDAFE